MCSGSAAELKILKRVTEIAPEPGDAVTHGKRMKNGLREEREMMKSVPEQLNALDDAGGRFKGKGGDFLADCNTCFLWMIFLVLVAANLVVWEI